MLKGVALLQSANYSRYFLSSFLLIWLLNKLPLIAIGICFKFFVSNCVPGSQHLGELPLANMKYSANTGLCGFKMIVKSYVAKQIVCLV